MTSILNSRHIQNYSDAHALEPHWGYVERVLPCTNDAGSCQYLDSVYHSHDLGMLYSFILWAVICGILFIWGVGRYILPREPISRISAVDGDAPESSKPAFMFRYFNSLRVLTRQYLLVDAWRMVFGRISRLQVLSLAILSSYLLVFTFVGIVYKTWITPVKSAPGLHNTRTGLGPFADRLGILAYALTPLTVMLSSRESILSLVTGIPYHHFNFLHRWLGNIMLVQGAVHSFGWILVEARLYQPQPKVWNGFVGQLYVIWGFVALIFLSFLALFSTKTAIRWTGYEFFRKSHYVVAMLYIGACWGHWSQLSCWMIASLSVWLLDRAIRLGRTAILHYGYLPNSTSSMGFSCAQAVITYFPDPANGDVVRLDFDHNHDAWSIGQHFFLCFPKLSIWQSHPFTPVSLPATGLELQSHTYIIRSKKGETAKLAEATEKIREEGFGETGANQVATPVILCGPYGRSIIDTVEHPNSTTNILCIAGGTGITFVLPVLRTLLAQPQAQPSDRTMELIWAVRKRSDLQWVEDELKSLSQYEKSNRLKIRVFVTREDATFEIDTPSLADVKDESAIDVLEISTPSSSSCCSDSIEKNGKGTVSIKQNQPVTVSEGKPRHPDLDRIVNEFVSSTVRGATCVYTSGPAGMVSDVTRAVASCNSSRKVWAGDERYDVQLIADDRLEW